MTFFDPHLAQGAGRMFPGTLGGQSQIATPLTRRRRPRRPHERSPCPVDLGTPGTFDYGTFRSDLSELWFPGGAHIDVRSYPSLVETDFLATPTHTGNSTTANRGAMTSDAADTFYLFCTDDSTAIPVLFAIDGSTHTATVLNDTTWTTDEFPVGLVWHPGDGKLYAVVQHITSGLGSFWSITTSGTASSLLVNLPLNFNGGFDAPIVATDSYVVSALDLNASPVGMFAWDVANATYTSDSSIENAGLIPTTVTDEVIAWDPVAVASRTWQITSPAGTPVFTETANAVRSCDPFSTVWFDDGYTSMGGVQVFHVGDLWRYP